jgi:hypothetical protein
MVGLGLGVLGVFLAEQARRWLQRAHQGISLDELTKVPALGDQGAGQRRAWTETVTGTAACPDSLMARTSCWSTGSTSCLAMI